MAALQAGMLMKMLELIDDPEAKATSHHRSVLLRIIAIVPALSPAGFASDGDGDGDGDGEEEEAEEAEEAEEKEAAAAAAEEGGGEAAGKGRGDRLWRPTLGFHLRVSDASHSLYVAIPPEDEEGCELVLSGELELGHFVYAERLERIEASPYPRLAGMKLLQRAQSGEELQSFFAAAAVEEIPQDLAIAIAGRARGSSESAREDAGNVVNKWKVSAAAAAAAANAMEAVLRAPIAIAPPSSPSLCRSSSRRRASSPSENRNPNLGRKGSMASSIDQRSDKLARSISAAAPLGLGLKLSDRCHGKKAEPFSADSAMESSSSSSSSKKMKSLSNSLVLKPCASAIARNPNPSDARNPNPSDARNPNPSEARNPNPSDGFNRAFLFEKTPIKTTQLSSRRSSSYGYGERVIIRHSSNRSSTAKKKLIDPAMASSSSGINERAAGNLGIASARREVRKDSVVLRERRSFRSPSPTSRGRSAAGFTSAKAEESHGLGLGLGLGLASAAARKKSCSDGILNRPQAPASSASSAIARLSTVLHSSAGALNRPQAPSSSAIARIIQAPPPASSSSSSSTTTTSTTTTSSSAAAAAASSSASAAAASSAVRSSRKGWDLRPLDSLLPQRRRRRRSSVDMASSRFSSAPRSSRISPPSSPLGAHGRSSDSRIKPENVRASRSISSSTSSQVPPSMARSTSNAGARIKNSIASASAPSSSSTLQPKQYMSPGDKSSRVVRIHDKRWTDGSVSWDSISPSLAALAKEIADFKRSASSAAAQALQEASVAESVLRNVSIFAELCSRSKPESPTETMERYFDFRRSLQLAMNVSMELSKSCQKKHSSDACADEHSLDIKEKKADAASSYKERLQCAAASWVSAALATDLVQVSEHAHQSNVESMKASKITGNSIRSSRRDSIDVSETVSSTKSSDVRGSCRAVGPDAMTKSQVFPSKTLLRSPGRMMLRPASPATQRRMSYTPVRSGKMSAKSHNNNRIAPASSSGEILSNANTLSRKEALDIVNNLFPQSSASHGCSTETGLALKGITASVRSLLQGEDSMKADNIAALARQLQTESQKWFFNYMEKALDCGLKFLCTEPARKGSRPFRDDDREYALGLNDNEALASAFPHLKQLNDWIGTLDYATLDVKMLDVLSRLKKKICHFLLQHIKTRNWNSNSAES